MRAPAEDMSGPAGGPPGVATAVSVVVPVYNSDAVVALLHERLCRVLSALPGRVEIILVDDASSDGSWRAIETLARGDSDTVAVRLTTNLGQGNATIIGLGLARGDVVATLDDDLQHPPEELPKLLDVLAARPDLDVVCSKPLARRHAWWRRAVSWALNLVASAILLKSPFLRFSAFRVMRKPVAEWLAGQRVPRPIVAALLMRHTRRIASVPTRHDESARGDSRYGLRELALVWIGYFQALRPARLWAVALAAPVSAAALAWWLAVAGLDRHGAVLLIAGLGLIVAMLAALGAVPCLVRSLGSSAGVDLEDAVAEVVGRQGGGGS